MKNTVLRPKEKARKRNPRGKGELLRTDLIDAAIYLLANLGPEEPFSLRAVAKQAKVSAPSVYRHFDDRNQLFLSVLQHLFTELMNSRQVAEQKTAAAGGGAWEKLLAGSLNTVRFALERSGHYKVLFEGRIISRLDDPKTASFGRPILTHVTELIKEIIKGNPAKRVTDDPERLALLLWTGTHGVISLIINKPTFDWPEAAELVEQMATAIICPALKKV